VWCRHVVVVWVLVLALTNVGMVSAGTGASPDGTSTVAVLEWDVGIPRPVVWTGDEVVMVGAQGTSVGGAQGAAFDVDRKRWRKVAPVPFRERLSEGDGVWTGVRVVVAGIRCENRTCEDDDFARCYPGSFAAAAWDPGLSQWRRVAGPRHLRFTPGNEGVWGRIVGAWRHDVVFEIRNQLWMLDGRDFTWRKLPDPPGRHPYGLCVADGRLVQVALSSAENEVATASVLSRSTARWRTSPGLTSPIVLDTRDFVCADDSVLVRTRSLSGVWRFDPRAREWSSQPVPGPKLTKGATFHSGFWTGREFVFKDDDSNQSTLAFDPRGGTWQAVAPPPFTDGFDELRGIAWADGIGYFSERTPPPHTPLRRLVAYRPTPL
jgi:hypothetical protein